MGRPSNLLLPIYEGLEVQLDLRLGLLFESVRRWSEMRSCLGVSESVRGFSELLSCSERRTPVKDIADGQVSVTAMLLCWSHASALMSID